MKDHLAGSCPEKTVPCIQADNGCTWSGRRVSLEAHVSQCPYESIKGFLAIHSTQMAQLSKENERLRRRTSELEGTVRILRQEVGWVTHALGPWYRPAYPERPSMSYNRAERPNEGDASARPVPSRVGPMLVRGAGGTPWSEPMAENGATEAFDFIDPSSFTSQRGNQVSGVYATNNASTTTGAANIDPNINPSANAGYHAAESHNSHDLNGGASYESGPSNGSGFVYTATGTSLSPGASNPQSVAAALPMALFSDHFPSEDREAFEGGSSSRPQSWQHVPSQANLMSSSPSPNIHSPVSISVLAP